MVVSLNMDKPPTDKFQTKDLEPGVRPRTPETMEHRDLVGSLVGAGIGGLVVIGVWKLFEKNGNWDGFYNYGLFLFVPFLMGFTSGTISCWKESRPRATIWVSAVLQCILASIALLVFGIEGMVCIVMAMPLVYPFVALGGFIARSMMDSYRTNPRILVTTAPVIVALGVGSNAYNPGFVTKTESTTIIVDAPPEKIWPYLFELSDLPEPEQWIFKTGIAYTKGTRSGGRNVGDARKCLLTTGVMNETITELVPNRYMRFDVHNTPPSIKEQNPFYDIHPRHETGCFKVHWGEFKLEPISGGRTRFTGTSTYSYNIFPAEYWGLWTDTVAEQIHVRMMGEIKQRVEVR